MIVLYNIAIYVYYLSALILSLFNKKARLWIKGRKGVFLYLRENIDSSSELVWFHASSVGEFEQGRPVMEAMKKKDPSLKILLTFFSPSGYELRKNYSGADYICYLPVDTKNNAKKFISLVAPSKIFFIKYEFWYHYITQARQNKIPVFSISAIFREKQIFFKWWGKWYARVINRIDHFFVQNDSSYRLLQKIGIRNVTVSGDSRFDRVSEIASSGKEIAIVSQFTAGKFTYVCGSTWPPDEDLLCKYINQSENNKFIIAPHEISESHLKNLCGKIRKKFVLFSKSNVSGIENFDVLIIDNIGMLSTLYKYGQVAYIGGGFGVGIHNTLEAAVYGIPVIFGPNYKKFQEARELLKCKGGYSIKNFRELESLLKTFTLDQEKQKKSGEAARIYVQSMTGATTIILKHLS